MGDHGQSWTRLPGVPDLTWVDWADEDRLVGLDQAGGVHISEDGGQSWAQGPQIGGEPVHAMSAGMTPEGRVELLLVGDAEVVAHEW